MRRLNLRFTHVTRKGGNEQTRGVCLLSFILADIPTFFREFLYSMSGTVEINLDPPIRVLN
jgi:hypothetical protein